MRPGWAGRPHMGVGVPVSAPVKPVCPLLSLSPFPNFNPKVHWFLVSVPAGMTPLPLSWAITSTPNPTLANRGSGEVVLVRWLRHREMSKLHSLQQGATQQCKGENYICNLLAIESTPVKQQSAGHFCVTLLSKVVQGVMEFMEIWIQLGASGNSAFVFGNDILIWHLEMSHC